MSRVIASEWRLKRHDRSNLLAFRACNDLYLYFFSTLPATSNYTAKSHSRFPLSS